MFLNIKKDCPVCFQGQIGFRKCANAHTLILMCDECDSIWISPLEIEVSKAIYLSDPDYYIPQVNCSLMDSRWATYSEIDKVGWSRYIFCAGTAMEE